VGEGANEREKEEESTLAPMPMKFGLMYAAKPETEDTKNSL